MDLCPVFQRELRVVHVNPRASAIFEYRLVAERVTTLHRREIISNEDRIRSLLVRIVVVLSPRPLAEKLQPCSSAA